MYTRMILTGSLSTATLILGVTPLFLGPVSEAAMRQSPKEARNIRNQHYGHINNILNSAEISKLHTNGILVLDDVLQRGQLELARSDIRTLQESNSFQKTEQDSPDVRTDDVLWISEPISQQGPHLAAGISFALRLVRGMAAEMLDAQPGSCNIIDNNNSMGVPFSNQLSCYQSHKAHYTPHRDCGEEMGLWTRTLQYFMHPGLQEREYTVILYLNDGLWADGRSKADTMNDGCLRCYMGAAGTDDVGSSATRVLDIEPNGGRMVIFDSKIVLHEVLATDRERLAITCWIGGSHGNYKYLRPYCVPYGSIK